MDGKPRRRTALALIAATLTGQAVIAIGLVVALAVMNAPGSPRPAPPRPAVSASAGPAGTAPAVTPQWPYETVPPFYAALTRRDPHGAAMTWDITLRDTQLAEEIARVAPPRPYQTFSMVSGTGDGKTFLAAAQQLKPIQSFAGAGCGGCNAGAVKLYLLLFTSGTHQVKLTPLPAPAMGGLQLWAAALSPDGTKLAVEVEPSGNDRQIRVYTLTGPGDRAGSPARTWTATSDNPYVFPKPVSPYGLSWSADGRMLAFTWRSGADQGLRLLDTAAPGGSLLRASTVILPLATSHPRFSCDTDPVMAGNGRLVLCAGDIPARSGVVPGIGVYAAATGGLLATIRLAPDPSGLARASVLWASPSGETLIVMVSTGAYGRLFKFTDGSLTAPIPRSADTSQIAW
jgi:hypothetical protein